MLINKKDMSIIEKLVKVTYEISEIYQKLYLLECNNKEQSKEYQDKIKELKLKLEEENDVYKLIYTSGLINKAMVVINDLEVKKTSNNQININYNIKDRIMQKLSLISSSTHEDEELRQAQKEVYYISLLALEEYKRYLIIIKDILKDMRKIDRQTVLYEKYIGAFKLDMNENYVIQNDFNPQKIETSIEYQQISETKKIENLLKHGIRYMILMLNYTDEDYENIYNSGKLLGVYIGLRSSMLLMNEEMIETLKEIYRKHISSNDYLIKHKNDKNKKAFKLLDKLFEESKNDKVRYRTNSI